MAQAVAEGATTEPNTRTVLLHASETTAEHVLNAHGYVFVTPETLGSMAGLMKDFFRPHLLRCARSNQWAALHGVGVRRQRRPGCRQANSAHCHGLAFNGNGTATHCVYPRTNA